MAIQFARIEIVGRSTGGNACCKGAYNARTKINDQKTNITYNFSNRGDNVYHDILLPNGVDQKFKNISELMNAVEHIEKKDNSQLLKDAIIALPDDKELDLQDRINITLRIIDKMAWVKNGLGVQVDIHQPHDGEKNWHAHLLITTRRFTADGKYLGKKSRDLNPEFKTGKYGNFIIPEEILLQHNTRDVINDYFKELGLDNRVDTIGVIPQEHIGPVRMRSALNAAVGRNEERKIANIELLRSGDDVLDRITSRSSVFNHADLVRAVKCVPDPSRADALIKDALASSQIISLYHGDGKESGLYTTCEVREQERKLMRLATAISSMNNLTGSQKSRSLVDEALVSQQQEALSHLVLAPGGMRVLAGRAGTGKSYVLGKLATISQASGVEVIGLAPTHKAKCALEEVGYKNSYTVKGFLFKLYNNRTTLAKNSLIVVDEAAMVGNDDYEELLRVAASNRCNVILSGDERQLSSINRGGMFTSFAKSLGFYELSDIRRQKVAWGKEVASAFARGDTKGGLAVLLEHKRLLSSANKIAAIEALLNKWHGSEERLDDKLIIAVKNSDVDIINAGARALLKSAGVLNGTEYVVKNQDNKNNKDNKDYKNDSDINSNSPSFMAGDRIVFKKSNKALGINNGDFASLESLNPTSFKAKLDNGKDIEFNPNEFSDFKHGYASTIYKAQGASIKDVYVFHDGFSTNRNTYVAMSRHVKDLHVFTHKEQTLSVEHLVKQLEFNPQSYASINYLTKDELNQQATPKQELGFLATVFNKVTNVAKERLTSFMDQRAVATDYYKFELPPESRAKVEEVLNQTYDNITKEYQQSGEQSHDQDQAQNQSPEQMMANSQVVNGRGRITTIATQTAKERFYTNVEYHRKQAKIEDIYKKELDALKEQMQLSSEVIATSLMGEPNKKLTNSSTYRYGNKGSLAITITGEKAGTWYDFEEGKGGDLISLVSREKTCDFKQSVEYVKEIIGNYRQTSLQLVTDHDASNKYIDHLNQIKRDQAARAAKARITQDLYNRSKDIEQGSVAARYLAEARGINCDLNADIKTTSILDRASGKRFPAIVAFARDESGTITGGQQLLLDRRTANKADVEVPKKSFGKIVGSFVEIAVTGKNTEHDHHNLTIIAEGLETALSIKQAGINAKIICSLGISNIKNYSARQGEKIIIAADHDRAAALTNQTISQAQVTLSANAMVRVVRPTQLGDFNDILQQQGSIKGASEIRAIFAPAINDLGRYSKKEVAIIADYEQLEGQSSNIDLFLAGKQQSCDDLLKFNPKYDIAVVREKLIDLKDRTREELLKHELCKEMKPCVVNALEQFKKDKLNSKDIDEFLKISTKEKEFCESMYKDHEVAVKTLGREGYRDLFYRHYQYETNPSAINNLRKYYQDAVNLGAGHPGFMLLDIRDKGLSINTVCDNIFRKCSDHVVNEVKTDLESITTHGAITKDEKEFTNHSCYLEHVMHDEVRRPYVNDFAKTKLFQINRANCQQRLVIYKEHKQARLLEQTQQQELEQQRKALELEKKHEYTYNRSL
ncbi:MAG: AAA family ATPase [Alphaproteobacteria bacterium]